MSERLSDEPVGRGGLLACGCVFLASLAVLLHSFRDQQAFLPSLFNSDTLFPSRIHDDLLRDNFPVRGWQYPMAPFWFPDIVFYVGVRSIIGHTTGAVIGYAVVQFVAVTLAFAWLGIAVRPDRWKTMTAISFLAGAAAAALITASRLHAKDWVMLLQLQLHTGALAVTVLVVGNVLFCLRAKRLASQLAWCVLSVLLLTPTVASDRLATLWCAIPLILTLIVARIFSIRSTETAVLSYMGTIPLVLLLVSLATSIVVGDMLYRTYHGGLGHRFLQEYKTLDSTAFANGLSALPRVLVNGSSSYWLTASAVIGVLCASALTVRVGWRFVVRPHPTAPTATEFVAGYSFCLTSLAVCVFAGVGVIDRLGASWPWAMKYLQPVFFGPWFGLACLVGGFGTLLLQVLIRLGMVSICVVLLSLFLRPVSQQQSYWHYYPDDIRELDDLAEQYGLEYGLGTFWESHRTTALSRRGLKVYGVEKNTDNPWGFTAYHWLSNRHWYRGTLGHPEPRYTFLLVSGADAPNLAHVTSVFGQPVVSRRIGDATLFIYNQPNSPFASAIRFDRPFITSGIDLRQSYQPLVYPGRSLGANECGVDTITGDRTAAPPAKAGHLAVSPRWLVKPGRYQLRITYSARDAKGTGWHLFEHHDSMGPNFHFHHMNWLTSGSRQVDTAIVTIPDRGSGEYDLSVRVVYGGTGEMTIHELEVLRLESTQ